LFEFSDTQSARDLAIAVRSNLHEFWRYLARSGHASVMNGPAMTRWHTQILHPWFNGMLCRTAFSDQSAKAVLEGIEDFRERGIQEITCWMAPDVPIDTWREWLQRNGFHYDANTPGMAVSIANLQPSKLDLDDFEIQLVTDSTELKTWVQTFIAGYQIPPEWEANLYNLMNDLGLEWPNRNYIGYWRGRPVATSNIFVGAGVAGIQFVATREEARRQGIGGAMSVAPLLDVQEIGCKIGVLQASDLGKRVYERMGFVQVCQMEHFYRNLSH